MKKERIPIWRNIHTVAFDFDGVFTDNKVWVNQEGAETVVCDRRDSLGLDLLAAFYQSKNLPLETYIVSREKNPVIEQRASKIGIDAYLGVSNKLDFVREYQAKKARLPTNSGQGILFVGNDLNDLEAVEFCEFSIVPSDAHPLIASIANKVLTRAGGDAFVREVVEHVIELHKSANDEIALLLN